MDILEARPGRADLEEALSAPHPRETASNSLLNSTTGLSLFCVLCAWFV